VADLVCSKIIDLKDQLWTVIPGLLYVLILADLFYFCDFNGQFFKSKLEVNSKKVELE